jgi:hypothetical protein
MAFVEGKRSLSGLESLFLSCTRTAQIMGARGLVDAAFSTLHEIRPTRTDADGPPISFYDPSRRLLTIYSPRAWPEISQCILDSVRRSPSADIGRLVRAIPRYADKLPVLDVKGINPIGKILIALGAAMDAPLYSYDDDEDEVPQTPREGPSLKEMFDLFRNVANGNWKEVLKSFPKDEGRPSDRNDNGPGVITVVDDWDDDDEDPLKDQGPAGLPESDDRRTLDEVVDDIGPTPELTQDEIDEMTAPTPPPNEDGKTLDEVLGDPEPPPTPEEIDEMTGNTPVPDDIDGPTGPALTPKPDDIGGPQGPAFTPNPESDRNPRGPAFTPRPDDDGGPRGPAARNTRQGVLYFPRAAAFFVPVRSRSAMVRALGLAQSLGTKGSEETVSGNFLLMPMYGR